MSETAEILKKARTLVEAGWCQQAFARTSDGYQCGPRSNQAVSWCAYGAVRCAEGHEYMKGCKALTLLARHCGVGSVTAFNDTHEHADVLTAFDRAIAAAEKSND